MCTVFLLLFVSGGYVFVIACRGRKNVDWLDEQTVSKTPNAQFYPYIVASDRWLKAHDARDVYTRAADGVQLHGLCIPAENSRDSDLL